MSDQGTHPAGWYPNPEGPGQRYWDGQHWTDAVQQIAPPSPVAETPQPGRSSARKKMIMVGAAILGGWILVAGIAALAGGGGDTGSQADAADTPKKEPKPKLTVTTETGSAFKGTVGYIEGRVSPASARLEINDKRVKVVKGSFRHRVRLEAGTNNFRLSAVRAGLEDYDYVALRRELTATEKAAERRRAEALRLKEQQAAEQRRIQAEQRRTQARQRFISMATTIPYNQLEKNADEFAGRKVTYRGQIFQIQEDYGSSVILLAVTDEGYGLWTDNIWVDYEGEIEGAEDDVITIHGTVEGSKNYETQMGGETYVPQIKAQYIDE